MKHLLMIIFVIALGSSCSTTIQKQCYSKDWQEIGNLEGKLGHEKERFSFYQNECGEYGIKPNYSHFIKGLNLGHQTFCYEKGQRLGELGDHTSYPFLCGKMSSFYKGRKVGLKEYCYEYAKERTRRGLAALTPRICQKKTQFKVGKRIGFELYCSEDNGIIIGKTGRVGKYKFCPQDLQDEFIIGNNKGTRHYCSKMSGYDLGINELIIDSGICPVFLKDTFRASFDMGKEVKRIERKILTIEQEVDQINESMSDEETPKSLLNYFNKQKKKKLMKKSVLIKRKNEIAAFIKSPKLISRN